MQRRRDSAHRAMIVSLSKLSKEENVEIYLTEIKDYYDAILNDTLLHLSRMFVTNYLNDTHNGKLLDAIHAVGHAWSLGTDVIDIIIEAVVNESIGGVSMVQPRPVMDVSGQRQIVPQTEQGAVQLGLAMNSQEMVKMDKGYVNTLIDSFGEDSLPEGYGIPEAKAFLEILYGYQAVGGFAQPNPRLAYKLVMKNFKALPIGSNTEVITAAVNEARKKIHDKKKGYEKTKLAIDYMYEMTMIFLEITGEGGTANAEENQIRFESFLNMYTTYRGMIEGFEQTGQEIEGGTPALAQLEAPPEIKMPIQEDDDLDTQLSKLKTEIYGMMETKTQGEVIDELNDRITLLRGQAKYDIEVDKTIEQMKEIIETQITEYYSRDHIG